MPQVTVPQTSDLSSIKNRDKYDIRRWIPKSVVAETYPGQPRPLQGPGIWTTMWQWSCPFRLQEQFHGSLTIVKASVLKKPAVRWQIGCGDHEILKKRSVRLRCMDSCFPCSASPTYQDFHVWTSGVFGSSNENWVNIEECYCVALDVGIIWIDGDNRMIRLTVVLSVTVGAGVGWGGISII